MTSSETSSAHQRQSSSQPPANDPQPQPQKQSQQQPPAALPPPPAQPPKPSACERCRRRKTKCDGQRPKCSSCIKANVDCIEHDANRRVERSYLTYLEQRIAYLEAEGRGNTGSSGQDDSMASNPSNTHDRNASTSESSNRRASTPTSDRNGPHLVDTTGQHHTFSQPNAAPPVFADMSLEMSPTMAPQQIQLNALPDFPNGLPSSLSTQPTSMGDNGSARKRKASQIDGDLRQRRPRRHRESSTSSDLHQSSSDPEADGLGPPTDQGHGHTALSCLVSVALEDRQEPHIDEHATLHVNDFLPAPMNNAERHFIHGELRALHNIRTKVRQQVHVPEIARDRTNIALYDRNVIARLMRRFFTWMGSVYPVLHEVTASLQVKAVCDGTATTLDKFQVWMALAVSLASLTRSHRRTSEVARLGKDFYDAARKLMPTILSRPGIERLQSVLLVLVYSLLVPRSASAAYLSTTAMQFAIELKLYSESSIKQKAGRDELMADVSRRIFWTSYNIDRSLSVITGKPTSLSDDWITTQFPLHYEDIAITREGLQPGAPICQLKVGADQHTRLRQLQSCIQARLYTPSPEHKATPSSASAASPEDESAATDAWSWEMYDRLRTWRDSFTYPTPFITQEWIKLQFHLTTTYLFRPSPRRPVPDLDAVHVTLHSSVETLKLYKTMHRNAAINFSWMATHNLFMSGLAFLSSLRELRKKNANCPSMSLVDSVLQVQACASVLEVLALSEGDSGCRARDAFEQVSTLIIRQLEKSALDRNARAAALRGQSAPSEPLVSSVFSPNPSDTPAQTPMRSPRASSALGGGYANADASSHDAHCKWALIALEDSSRTYFMAVDRDGQNGLNPTNPNEEEQHFLTHDRDNAPIDADRFASVPKHLYSVGFFPNVQPRGGKAFWASFVSRGPSRATSPSASGPGGHTTEGAVAMRERSKHRHSTGQGIQPSMSDSAALNASLALNPSNSAVMSMPGMNSVGNRALEYGTDDFSPPGISPHYQHQQLHSQQNHHQHRNHQGHHQSGSGRRNASGPSVDGISPPSSAGTFDEFNLMSWFADPTSQAPSDGLGFTDLASENAMLQALGLSLPLPGLMPPGPTHSNKPSPSFGPDHDIRDAMQAELPGLQD